MEVDEAHCEGRGRRDETTLASRSGTQGNWAPLSSQQEPVAIVPGRLTAG